MRKYYLIQRNNIKIQALLDYDKESINDLWTKGASMLHL